MVFPPVVITYASRVNVGAEGEAEPAIPAQPLDSRPNLGGVPSAGGGLTECGSREEPLDIGEPSVRLHLSPVGTVHAEPVTIGILAGPCCPGQNSRHQHCHPEPPFACHSSQSPGRQGSRTADSRRPVSDDLFPGCGALRKTEDQYRVAERIAELEVAATGHGDELLTPVHERHRRGIAASAAIELPELFSGLRAVGVEVAVAFTGECEAAGRGERAAHHGLGHLVLPGDLAGLEVHRGVEPVLLFTRDGDEGRSEPELALLVRRGMGDVVHRLVQAGHEGIAEGRIDCDG